MNRWILISMGLAGGLPEAEASEKCSGWIAVESVPAQGGNVVLDGVETSHRAPATLKNVPCGLHEVGIAHEDYRGSPRRLRVKKNQVHKVQVKLQAYTGRLLVDTLPYAAEVKIDGRPVGRAPISKKDFPAGEHTIVATAPDLDTQTMKIRIQKDHTTVIELNLKEPAASFSRTNAIKVDIAAEDDELELAPLVPPDYQPEKKKKTVVAKKPKPSEIDKRMGMKPDGSLIRLSDPGALQLRNRLPQEISTRRTWAWISAGTATTAAVATVVLFAVGASNRADADSLAGQLATEQDPYRRQEIQSRVLALDDQADRQNTGAWVCAGVFAVAAGAALYLFLSEPDETPRLQAAALPGGGGWVGVQGRF